MNWNVTENIYKSYINVCKNASIDNMVFNSFKSNKDYTSILEHANKNMGHDYIEYINSTNPSLLEFKKFFTNDMLGNPNIFDYGTIKASPTTLAYISVLSTLINKLGSLENFNIVEIGGGYGGQAKIITDYFNIQSYDIIDIHEVTLLQNTYIKKANIPNTFTYTPQTYNKTKSYDLVISCYALSEVTEPLQSEYMNNIVLKSAHGYMSLNGPITMFNELENKYAVEKYRLPKHSKLGKIFNNNACNLIW